MQHLHDPLKILIRILDPRRYPFKVYLPTPYPLINTDIHLLSKSVFAIVVHLFFSLPIVEHSRLAHVNITLKEMVIPFQIIQQTSQRFLLRFRPIFTGEYSIVLTDSTGQSLPGKTLRTTCPSISCSHLGCPHIFPIHNPNGIRLESCDPLQPIHD